MPDVELHLVTRDDVPDQEACRAHHGLTPNSPALIELYHRGRRLLPADAAATACRWCCPRPAPPGSPLVSTDVGAIREIVRDGETGLLVPPGDQVALTSALRRLVLDGDLRARLGAAAAELVKRDHDAAANAARLADLLAGVARR